MLSGSAVDHLFERNIPNGFLGALAISVTGAPYFFASCPSVDSIVKPSGHTDLHFLIIGERKTGSGINQSASVFQNIILPLPVSEHACSARILFEPVTKTLQASAFQFPSPSLCGIVVGLEEWSRSCHSGGPQDQPDCLDFVGQRLLALNRNSSQTSPAIFR